MNMNNEVNQQFEEDCLFEIDVEHLIHISPNYGINGPRVESRSEKYLAVLDQRDRTFLGVKKYFKSYAIEKSVPQNREINSDALAIFSQFSDNKKINLYNWKISKEKNQFFVVYLGLDAITYCNNIDWASEKMHTNSAKILHQRFIKFKEDYREKFEMFLSDFCGQKRIYFSASNSYDLQLPRAEFNMGITDPFTVNGAESIHVAQKNWSRSGMWFPVSEDFRRNLIEIIMISFTLSQITIRSEMFIPVLLDLESYDLRIRSLERKKKLLEKVALTYNLGKKYIEVNADKERTYFDLLYPTGLIRVRSLKGDQSELEYGEFTHFFSKDNEDERKLSDLLTVINYSDSERKNYEFERREEFEDVRELIISKLQSIIDSTKLAEG